MCVTLAARKFRPVSANSFRVTTPELFRRQERLPGPAEGVQDQIARLAEGLDKLFGKGHGEHRRVMQTFLNATDAGDDHVDNPSNTVYRFRRAFKAWQPFTALGELD